MSKRKRLTADQKVMILRELLENNVQISQLAEKYNVHVNDIYNWKKKLFESAADIFTYKSEKQTNSAAEKKIEILEEKLKNREEAITYLVTETIELKKNLNGED
jgi:transposase